MQYRPKKDRESWLVTYLASVQLSHPLKIGYAFYDSADGIPLVLHHDEYHESFLDVSFDLIA